ncbi:MAG: FAD-dependent oxidoreductase, partial [Planctomycetia bacterium]
SKSAKVILSDGSVVHADIVILGIGVQPESKLAREAGLEVNKRGAIRVQDTLQTNDHAIYALGDASEVNADIVILGIGVQPESKLAREAGLEVNKRGAIRVQDTLQTNDPAIYAIGDAIEVKDVVSGNPTQIPLAGPATRQGRIVANNIAGIPTTYRGTLGTAIIRVFDLTAACTGASAKALTRANIPFKCAYLHPNSHAGYYPGAHPIHMKILFSPKDGKILGAQAVGM